ncbi:hypothetical protein J7J81_03310 [bacterium]|nr:hypothetical protein [bacterium]
MELEDIRQFVNSNNEKIILVEHGEPTVVLMSYETYKESFGGNFQEGEGKRNETNTEVNLAEKKPFFESNEPEDLVPGDSELEEGENYGSISIDDLPF